MSHQIDTIAFVGETPWHGLGVRCDAGLSSREFWARAGLLWEPTTRPLFFADGTVVPDAKSVGRSDRAAGERGFHLGTVGADWTPFGNEALRQLCDALTVSGEAAFHTAGALKFGGRVWALLQCEGQIVVRDGDVLAPFLLVSNGHDGSRALRVQYTTIRVVCANTEALAISEKLKGVRFNHTSQLRDVSVVAAAARKTLDLAFESFEQQGQVAVALSGARFSRDEARAFFAKIVTGEDNLDDAKAKLSEAKGAARTKLIDQGATLVDLFENGRGNQGETKWDAYNAVTEFIDHQKSRSAAWKAKQKQLGVGSSLDSVWFGTGEQKKERALRLLRAA